MFRESIAIAFNALVGNKLRSILTMLGIIIGVGAVIAMVSIGMGVRDKVSNSIAGLGSNLIMVTPGAPSAAGVRQAAGSGITLTIKDSQAISREVAGVSQVAPSVSRQYQLVAGNQNWTTSVQGTTPEFLEVRNMSVQAGSFITTGIPLVMVKQRKRLIRKWLEKTKNRQSHLPVLLAEHFF